MRYKTPPSLEELHEILAAQGAIPAKSCKIYRKFSFKYDYCGRCPKHEVCGSTKDSFYASWHHPDPKGKPDFWVIKVYCRACERTGNLAGGTLHHWLRGVEVKPAFTSETKIEFTDPYAYGTNLNPAYLLSSLNKEPEHIRHYWDSRRITAKTQAMFLLGYDKRTKRFSIPYLNAVDGKLQVDGIQLRIDPLLNTHGTYDTSSSNLAENAEKPRYISVQGSRQAPFGAMIFQYEWIPNLVLVEDAISAMSLIQLGYPAVAVKPNNLFEGWLAAQMSKVGSVVIWADNDAPGKEIANSVRNALCKNAPIITSLVKDANDLLVAHGRRAVHALMQEHFMPLSDEFMKALYEPYRLAVKEAFAGLPDVLPSYFGE